ncbi:MAG: Fpg/Nei family DNA glycosylase [Edaphobacter sp.]|uniref:Fpg/Nei family DNA glycosylase n=1 Tax=Edaphobacter sp. TaxID=1934404 RepID=UPI00239EEA91|nr:DNA-formamidopyrimidine glycosylase family protein [Edaphobacter sp.]MDE1177910.1 Fpg/Nei family DNA glycosylase [Edaphobacter sp.]
MPEGDTIFRSARALERAIGGKIVTGFETGLAKLARVNDDTPLTGRTIEKVESRGKWLLIFFSGDLILVTHMLMSGSWHLYRTGERWKMGRSRMRVVIRTADWEAVAFNVPIAEFYTTRTLERSSQVPKLGPDILSQDFTVAAGVEQLKTFAREHPEAEVGNALLNQRVMAGLGNVYKSEVAFAARVHPFRTMPTLTQTEMETMVDFAQRYMRANINDGSHAIVTYSGNRRTTHAMDREERLWVYGRQGQECRRCGTAIMMRRQGLGARSTYWCPQCQPWTGEGAAPVGTSTIVKRGRIGC